MALTQRDSVLCHKARMLHPLCHSSVSQQRITGAGPHATCTVGITAPHIRR